MISENETTPDEEILSLSISRPSLFEIIVNRYQGSFLRKAMRVVRSREESEDIVQETFTKIYVNARKFRRQEGASFRSWAYTILTNTTFSHYQKLKKGRESSIEMEEDAFDLFPDSEDGFEREAIRDQVVSVLSRMPSKLARALKAHFIDDKPHAKIADEEGVGVGVIKTRVLRAKRAFKKISSEKFGFYDR